jgi:predicted 2-oxoglutarate/Fe(II)-dependent dioxygenase YbiX
MEEIRGFSEMGRVEKKTRKRDIPYPLQHSIELIHSPTECVEQMPAFLTNWIPAQSITHGKLFGLEEDSIAVIEVPHLFNETECEYIIELGKSKGLSPLQTNKYGDKIDSELRTDLNTAFENPILTRFLMDRLCKVVPLYLEREQPAAFAGLNPLLRFNLYPEGTYFKEHVDGVFYSAVHPTCSVYTMILYLNDDFSAGETVLHIDGTKRMSIVPQIGKVLILDQRIKHEGRPVSLGEKMTLRTDIMYLMQTDRGECGICLESLGNQMKVRLPCNHAFHRKCVEMWLRRNHSCPMCRYKLLIEERKGLGFDFPVEIAAVSETPPFQPALPFPLYNPIPLDMGPIFLGPGGLTLQEIHQMREQSAQTWQNRPNIPPGYMD